MAHIANTSLTALDDGLDADDEDEGDGIEKEDKEKEEDDKEGDGEERGDLYFDLLDLDN
jgi:hypothetical protein